MSKKNIANIAASENAKKERKALREAREPVQKILNTKSPRCRQCVGTLLYQDKETVKEILGTIEEVKSYL